MIIPAKWFGTPVVVRTYEGAGSLGLLHANPVACLANKDETRVLVTSANGSEEVAEMTLRVQPEHAALFTPESLVTVNGRSLQVITSSPHEKYGVNVYQEVTCK